MLNRQPKLHRLSLVLAISSVLASTPLGAQETPAPLPPATQATDLDRIEVVGVREALFNARAQERETDVISNVVTADDAGQFSDQNVAESLQRVPGLSIDRDAGEGRRVNVRGLGPSFNPVTINGVTLATSDLDRDAVVDILPNDLLGTLTVTKTLTPDMNADAIGGAVDLRAIDPRERDTGGSARVEVGKADYADGLDPKVSALFSGRSDNFGFSIAGSYSERDVWGDIQRNRDVPLYNRLGTTNAQRTCNQGNPEPGCVLRSVRVENRFDRSERRRLGLAGNFVWRPQDGQEFFLRLIGARYKLDEERYVDRWQMGAQRATALGPGTGSFQGGTDVELRKQISFNKRNETTSLAHIGGQTRTDDWTFDYSAASSRNRLEIPQLLTGRFRIRNIGIDYVQDEDSIAIGGRRVGTGADPANPAAYAFDQVTVQTEDREDKILQANFDARRDFDWGERQGFFKAGVKGHRRDKTADREEAVGEVPGSAGINLGALPLQQVETRIPGFGFQPEGGAAEDLFRRNLFRTTNASFGNSVNEDYTVEEDVDAAYLMGSIDLAPSFSVFGGVRYEATQWSTSGFERESFENAAGVVTNTVRPISVDGREYSNLLPSVHMRWEPSETLVIRGSVSSAIVRPNFDEAAATREIQTEEVSAGVFERSFSGGNPALDPLTADQFDLSVAWYPNAETFLYAGLFYKRIDDFYVDGLLIGPDVARAGLPVGDGTRNGGFDEAEVIVNGDRATVRGIELAYEQAFVYLPGWLSGLFASVNLTLVDSEADYGPIFNNRVAALPDQADRIANVSLGWENERFTVRASANYRDEQLDIVNSNPVFDQVVSDYRTYDLNLRWNINEYLQLYFDGSNLTDEKDLTVWRGDASSGGSFPADEGGAIDFGRSYAVGMRYKF